jgi:hypothetical protein
MLTDRENDVVYASDQLEPAHPALVDRLRSMLGEHGVGMKTIRGTRDHWCGDSMPVQIGRGSSSAYCRRPRACRGSGCGRP